MLLGWGVLLSWWELSNVIKIHAGVLHIQPVELTGRKSASKQALPSLFPLQMDAMWPCRVGGQITCAF